jgi:hypothetical protein
VNHEAHEHPPLRKKLIKPKHAEGLKEQKSRLGGYSERSISLLKIMSLRGGVGDFPAIGPPRIRDPWTLVNSAAAI